MALPNAFIVGVPKSGTTAIFTSLSRQANVCASTTKEAHFFDSLKYGQETPPLSEYEKLFKPKPTDSVLIEATPSYFTGGAVLAARLRQVSPNAKAAIILREPGSRAFSWYRFQRTRLAFAQDLDFDRYLDRCEALGLDPEQRDGLGPWTALSGGLYSTWLPGWQQVFGQDLLVMYSDDLRRDPDGSLERIGAHFGIEITEPQVRQQNVSVDISRPGVQKLALKINHAGELLWRRFPGFKQRLMGVYYRVNARKSQEQMTTEQRARLDEYFAPSIRELREQLSDVPYRWGAR